MYYLLMQVEALVCVLSQIIHNCGVLIQQPRSGAHWAVSASPHRVGLLICPLCQRP